MGSHGRQGHLPSTVFPVSQDPGPTTIETPCPCCGKLMLTRVPALVPTTGEVWWEGRHAYLTPTSQRLFQRLAESYPRQVEEPVLISWLWGWAKPSYGADQTLRVHISKLRKALQPLGWDVDNRWGGVYSLRRAENG